MEIKEGILKVKIKKNGSRDNQKTHILIAKQKLPISKEFQLDNSMNNKNCKVFLDNGKIIDIEIDGKKIDKVAKKIVKKLVKCKNKDNLRVPNDTCLILQNPKINIDNFYLKLNKFTIFNDNDEAKIKEQNISEEFFYRDWSFYNKQIKNYYKDIEKLNLKFSELIELKTNYRLVIGSEQSIYETSIRLHHIYGIPYIPASAIKGVVRSYYILEKFANKLEEYKDRYNKFEEEVLFKKEDGKYKEKCFVDIFGSQEQEGKIIFFDAFPTTKPKIKIDIMNPHYGHYYNDGKAPTDTKNPIPINFLTIENTTFKFFIASKESLDKNFITLFKEALQDHGIGGKTAVGYGIFVE